MNERRFVGSLRCLLLAAWLLALPALALAQADFGTRVSGQRVYDRAGVLTAADVAALEAKAAAVEAAGAPTVVYLRRRDADHDRTEQDAADLMTAWGVESAAGRRDGVVVLLNLKPADPKHGEAVIYAGQTLANGRLPSRELQRIFDTAMRGPLRDGRTADGVAAGLDAVASTLTYGPPPPSAGEQAFRTFAGGPLAALATVLALGVGAFGWTRSRRAFAPPAAGAAITVAPETLEPAYAGALVAGRVGNSLFEATVLDLARRGALAFEAAGPKTVQIRLLHPELVRRPFEESVWRSLAERAGVDGVVPPKELANVPKRWGLAGEVLTNELVERGWFDRAAGSRRGPIYATGALGLALAFAAFVAAAVGESGAGIAGAGLLAAAGVAAICWGYGIRGTTEAGEGVAAAWSGYREGLRRAARDRAVPLDLDDTLPYAVALGVTSDLDRRLKDASQAGYAPAWFHRTLTPATDGGNPAFYGYWASFHSSVNPSSSGSSGSSGAGAGGSSGGGSF